MCTQNQERSYEDCEKSSIEGSVIEDFEELFSDDEELLTELKESILCNYREEVSLMFYVLCQGLHDICAKNIRILYHHFFSGFSVFAVVIVRAIGGMPFFKERNELNQSSTDEFT